MPESAEKPEALSFRGSPVSLAYPPYPGALAGVASLARGSTHKPALPTDTRRTKAFPYTKGPEARASGPFVSQIQALSLSCFLGRPMSARRASLGSCPS